MENYTKKPLSKFLPEVAVILTRGRDDNPILGWLRMGIRFFSSPGKEKKGIDHVLIYKKSGFRNSKGKVIGNVIEALFEGVKITDIKRYINDKDGLLVMTNKRLEKEPAFSKFTIAAERSVGRGYDFLGIGGFVSKFFGGKKAQDDKTNFCSELAQECLTAAGLSGADEDAPSPFTMKEFMLSKKGRKEGWILYDYQNLGTEFFDTYELKPIR